MDALSDVLRVMRLKGGVFLYGEFRAPWCISVKVAPESCAAYLGETAHVIPYHFVLDGLMRVRMEDGEEIALTSGQSVLFPRNDLHLLGSTITRSPTPSQDVVERPVPDGPATISFGGDGPVTRIVCGFLGTEDIRGNPVVNALPPVLPLDVRDGSEGAWIRSTFDYAAGQIAAGRLGSEAVMSTISELLFVEAVRRYSESMEPAASGWLAGLRDNHVSRAMALMHADLAAEWTVDSLGRAVGLSRSALAARFARVLGMAPMQYLAQWRIHAAAHELLATDRTIAQVAVAVGYESEASFSRAFRRVMGIPPATWRQRKRAEAPASAEGGGPGPVAIPPGPGGPPRRARRGRGASAAPRRASP